MHTSTLVSLKSMSNLLLFYSQSISSLSTNEQTKNIHLLLGIQPERSEMAFGPKPCSYFYCLEYCVVLLYSGLSDWISLQLQCVLYAFTTVCMRFLVSQKSGQSVGCFSSTQFTFQVNSM